jgi:hypothetical protein
LARKHYHEFMKLATLSPSIGKLAQASKGLKESRALKDLEERQALQELCETVNDPPSWIPDWMPIAGVQRFKDWVVAWRAAPSLQAMVDGLDHVQLGLALPHYIHADYVLSPSHHHAELKVWAGRPWQKQTRYTPDEVTLELFARLIINPQCFMFGGPCPHCDRCFVKTQRRQRFCNRKCNSAHTAPNATKKRRERIRRRKCKFSEDAKREYKRLLSAPDPWQEWVAKKATRLMRNCDDTWDLSDITRTFVTHNIKPPKMVKKARSRR